MRIKKHVLARPEQMSTCLAEKLLTYATGRAMGFSYHPSEAAVATTAQKKKNGFRSLVHEVVQSPTFRTK